MAKARAESDRNWLISIIDLLASEYGWTKDYILKRIYPIEAMDLADRIKARANLEHLIQLAIVGNPWSKEPKKLYDEFEKGLETGLDLSGDTMDKGGIKNLKNMLRKSKNIGVN